MLAASSPDLRTNGASQTYPMQISSKDIVAGLLTLFLQTVCGRVKETMTSSES